MPLTERQKQRMTGWWEGNLQGGPLLYLTARRETAAIPVEAVAFDDARDYVGNAPKRDRAMRDEIASTHYFADAFPTLDTNLIAGSLAVYLGCEPVFTGIGETVWHQPAYEGGGLGEHPLPRYDPRNPWWQLHREFLREAAALSHGDYAVGLPGLQENLDTLCELRGAGDLMLDIIDDPETVAAFLERIDQLYFTYTGELLELLRGGDGGNFYNGFRIWGPGPTAKLQCDASAMVSTEVFGRYVLPMLERQCDYFAYPLYHLDGPGALHHLDSLLSLQKLRALQWVPGAGSEDALSPTWYPYLDRVREKGKALWLAVDEEASTDRWLDRADRLVHRYGAGCLYLHFPNTSEASAHRILEHAARRWGTAL